MAISVKSLIKFFVHRAVEVAVVLLLIVIMPNVPPQAKISTSYSIPKVSQLENNLQLNNKLDDVELWHQGDFVGPETIKAHKGDLYVTIHGGDIVRLTTVGNHVTPIVKFGKPCKGIWEEAKCGRPLGIAFDADGHLYACDAYYGVYKVNLQTGKHQQLVSMDGEINGAKPRLPNSLAVASDGDIYWSDSSTEFGIEDGVIDMFADGSGRLIHYNRQTGENTVLIDGIHFANGVVLSPDESYVLVCETGANRVHRYYLKGAKRGERDVFVDGLPGLPDNIQSDGKGGYLVPLVVAVDASFPSPFQILRPFPMIRKLIARLFGLTELAFRLVDQVYPNQFAQKAIHMVGHFSVMHNLFSPKRTTIVRLSGNGEIIGSAHTTKGDVTGISDASVHGGFLYLGSPFNDYIGRIRLETIGWHDLIDTKPEATTTTTTKKPITTTTQKPTTTTTTQRPTTTTTTTQRPTTTTTTQKPSTTTTQKATTTTTQKPSTTTTQKATTTTTQKPTTTTTQKPTTTTTTQKPTTTTQKSTTTTQKPSTTTPKPVSTTTTSKPTTTTTQKATTPKAATTTTKPATKAPAVEKSTTPSKQSGGDVKGEAKGASPIRDQPKAVPVN